MHRLPTRVGHFIWFVGESIRLGWAASVKRLGTVSWVVASMRLLAVCCRQGSSLQRERGMEL